MSEQLEDLLALIERNQEATEALRQRVIAALAESDAERDPVLRVPAWRFRDLSLPEGANEVDEAVFKAIVRLRTSGLVPPPGVDEFGVEDLVLGLDDARRGQANQLDNSHYNTAVAYPDDTAGNVLRAAINAAMQGVVTSLPNKARVYALVGADGKLDYSMTTRPEAGRASNVNPEGYNYPKVVESIQDAGGFDDITEEEWARLYAIAPFRG